MINFTFLTKSQWFVPLYFILALSSWYLISYSTSNKKISCSSDDQFTTEELVQKARIIFPQLEDVPVQLQCYDKDVEEFIDCEDADVIMPRSKIRVKKAEQAFDGTLKETPAVQ